MILLNVKKETPLVVACDNSNLDCVTVLLTKYHDLHKDNKILTHGYVKWYMESIIFWAVRHDRPDILEYILAECIKIGLIDITKNEHTTLADTIKRNGDTPLSIAIRDNHPAIAKVLIFKYNANVNAIIMDEQDQLQHKSMLYLACETNHDKIIPLLSAKMDVENGDIEKGCEDYSYKYLKIKVTPLMIAAINGYRNIV